VLLVVGVINIIIIIIIVIINVMMIMIIISDVVPCSVARCGAVLHGAVNGWHFGVGFCCGIWIGSGWLLGGLGGYGWGLGVWMGSGVFRVRLAEPTSNAHPC
jgi:hypothetical protein